MVEIALGGPAEQEVGRGRRCLFCVVGWSALSPTLQCHPCTAPSELEGVLRSSGGVCFEKGRKGKRAERDFKDLNVFKGFKGFKALKKTLDVGR